MNAEASREHREHGSEYKPFGYYKCSIPEYFINVPLHWHPELELNYILDGCAEFICGDEKFSAHAGELVVILPDMLHSVSRSGENHCAYDTLVFGLSMLGSQETDRSAAMCIQPLGSGCGVHSLVTGEHPYYQELRTSAEQIFSCAKGDTAMLDMLMKSELMRLFWLLYESGSIYPVNRGISGNAELIRPAVQYISENFSEPITIDMLAEISHLSRSYFMSCFRQAAGMGAIEYVNQVRARAAVKLLGSTEKTIAEIAYECGFRNLSNFNRQFKSIAGVTPSEYRSGNRKRCG